MKRFWNKVRKTRGCWIWTSAITDRGYGVFQIGDRTVRAHRYAWELSTGEDPGDLFVCHSCDNPRCVNPRHLFLGTHQDNMDDKKRKGRASRQGPIKPAQGVLNGARKYPERLRRGEENPKAKLTSSQAAEIKSSQDSLKTLADRFGVSVSAIWCVRSGKTWRQI